MGRIAAAFAASVALLPASVAAAQPVLVIDGAGNGHGVGLGQWGAYGLALHGFDYRSILLHYYPATGLQTLPTSRVRVLMQTGRPSARLSGAVRVGNRRLDPNYTYVVRRRGAAVVLDDGHGHALATAARLAVVGHGPLRLAGRALNGRADGTYRGSLELRPASATGVDVSNVVGLDDYVRGVVAAESDAQWPLAELEAQAVASRTFAITAGRLYADTRSQQYNGVAAETPSTNRAVALTAGQVVTYRGKPAITYFYDSSGGQTENVEFGFPGTRPEPWLKAVADPYDTRAPLHRWSYRLSLADAQARLGGLLKGTLQSIDVVRRGVSPRVVSADVVGSGGRTRVDGPRLQSRLRLPSTWACFTVTPPSALTLPGWDAECRLGLSSQPSPGSGGGVAAP